MIKTNIKMRVTPEESVKVQEICFKNGIEWQGGGGDISLTNEPFLFIRTNNRLSFCSNESEFKSNENIEIDPRLFIRTNGSCIEKEEFTYPMWFKSKMTDIIVRFDSFNKGEVVYVSKEESFYTTGMTLGFIPHTDTTIWEQVENPNLATDKEIEQVINEEYEKDSSINKDKQDMINPSHYKKGGIEAIEYMKAKSTPEEFKGHLRLTALKYLSRYGQKDNELQELEKAKWYLDRLIQELKNEN